ncbi:MAG: hypothetical protein Q7R81_06070 [Candidatus Peregrinibacteria bacterium]|nr:hypothetical protein [Candidatus Peregrinibacteria bacterium]
MRTSRALLFASCSLLLCGCIKIDATQTIGKDGSVSMELVFDASQIQSLTDSLTESLEEAQEGRETSLTDSPMDEFNCDEFTTKLEESFSNVTCEMVDEGVLRIRAKSTPLPRSAFTSRKSSGRETFTYRVSDVLRVMGTEDEPLSPKDLQEQKGIVTWKYTIVMPGKIKRSSIGKIKGSKVTFDLAELATKPNATIMSESPLDIPPRGSSRRRLRK